MNKITTQGMRFVDEYGRERIFRGVNLVDKKPYRGNKTTFKYPVDDTWLSRCRSLGFNMLRLGVLWEVLEPQPGEYNEGFIDELAAILDRCEKYGIYVFIDIHQDVYSEYANLGGSGAPEWATLTDGYKVKKTKFVWAEGYFFRKAVWAAFNNFWNNAQVQGKGLQDWYADMLRHIALRFKDKPAFFGYDIMNEPFADKKCGYTIKKLIASVVRVVLTDKRVRLANVFRSIKKGRVFDAFSGDLVLKITAAAQAAVREFEDEYYTPFLNKMTGAIREIDSGHIIFIANSYYSNSGIPCTAGPIKTGDRRDNNQCFAPHAYDFTVDTPAYEYANNDIVKGLFAEHRRTQERLNVPVVVGEWGGGGDGVNWYPHISYLLDLFEKNKWSNTYYFYLEDAEEMAYRNKQDIGKKDLFEIPLADTVLNRPFPMAVCGEIESYHYDGASKTFVLEYSQSEACDMPNELFLPSAPAEIILSSGGRYELKRYGEGYLISWRTEQGKHKLEVFLS